MTCCCENMGYGICYDCKAKEEEELVEKICKGWSWNASAREAAREAYDMGWSTDVVKTAMAKCGFKQHHIDEVVYEMEVGE